MSALMQKRQAARLFRSRTDPTCRRSAFHFHRQPLEASARSPRHSRSPISGQSELSGTTLIHSALLDLRLSPDKACEGW
jgi:hypothetical protein